MLCPVCNGLSLLYALCPNCGAAAEDEGRRSDWSGPYSPYEPSPLAASHDGDAEGSERFVCEHAARCAKCDTVVTVEVEAWHL